MNRKLIVSGLIMMVVSIILAGCGSPVNTTTADPPAATISCPTAEPLSCPTAIVQAPAAPNSWRNGYSQMSNVVVTFDAGDKCTIDVKNPITGDNWSYEINVNDQTYQNYIVSALTLDDGKTLKDLQDYNSNEANSTNPPDWSQLKLLEITGPLSTSWHGITMTGKPLYFVCLVQGPSAQKIIYTFGPVKQAP